MTIRYIYIQLAGALRNTKMTLYYEDDASVVEVGRHIAKHLGALHKIDLPENDACFPEEDLERAKRENRFVRSESTRHTPADINRIRNATRT